MRARALGVLCIAAAGGCAELPARSVPTTAEAIAPAAPVRHAVRFESAAGLVFVPVRLDGIDRELWFLLDTGAPTVIREALVEELGLARGEDLAGHDLQGESVGGALVVLPGLSVGGFHLSDVSAMAGWLPALNATCHAVDGVLGNGFTPGTGFLDRAAVEIDYDDQRLVIAESGASLTAGGITVPLRRTRVMPDNETVVTTGMRVQATVEGREGWIRLDTGAQLTYLGEDLFAHLGRSLGEDGLVAWRGAMSKSASGVTREGMRHEGRLRSLQLGTRHFEAIPIMIEGSSLDGISDLGGMVLGYEFLRHFTLVVDLPSDVARLVPNEGADPQQSPTSTGLGLGVEGERVRVNGLAANGSAERAGVAFDDEVVAVEGVAIVDAATYCEAYARAKAPEDGIVSFELVRDGRPLAIDVPLVPILPEIVE